MAPQNAERCAYLVVPATDAAAIDAAAVLERGRTVDALASGSYTAEG
ncbi:MAG: hypothetical protein ACLS37_08210 [Alistipes sp.]